MLSLTDSHAWQVTDHFSASSLPFVTQLFLVQRVSDRLLQSPSQSGSREAMEAGYYCCSSKQKHPFI